MDRLVKKYADKLITAGLARSEGPHRPLVGGLDDTLIWNCKGPEIQELEKVFDGLNINSLVFLRPAPPYDAIIQQVASRAEKTIEPKDCETRTFLHDLPVVRQLNADAIVEALKHRKSVIVHSPDASEKPAVIAHGTVSPEQGFVVVSSVCFACFVKYFTDYLAAVKRGQANAKDHDTFDKVTAQMDTAAVDVPNLMTAPFDNEASVYKAIAEAGRETVRMGLVDSYFGNVSYCWNNTLYISQTGSSLDDLIGCVDPIPLDGTSTAGITASSELSAHLETITRSECKAILHGHPKFAVILSMDCPPDEKDACEFAERCHTHCPKPRHVGNVPVVPGEVGTGPTGLCRTLPAALETNTSTIVYGHGLFTTGKDDFNEAFTTLVEVEHHCRELYFDQVHMLRASIRS